MGAMGGQPADGPLPYRGVLEPMPPHRSWVSITHRAQVVGLSKRIGWWSKDDDALLRHSVWQGIEQCSSLTIQCLRGGDCA